MLKAYRCLICGETYLGETASDRCPFCGAAGKHLVAAAEWIPHGKVALSEQSYQDCQKALELELENMAFYQCAAKKTTNQIMQAYFKRLAKQEGEHAEVLCKMMGIDEPAPPSVTCPDNDHDNMEGAHKREDEAVQFYQEVANRASEARVQEVFRALTEIEAEHLIISSIYR
ncbi:MAG: ferritin family protein [Bacillota bacterium]|nr:ferritin family protein [Bacillota bacterium]